MHIDILVCVPVGAGPAFVLEEGEADAPLDGLLFVRVVTLWWFYFSYLSAEVRWEVKRKS